MSGNSPADTAGETDEEILTPEEFSEVIAEHTSLTAEELEQGAEELDWPRPWEGTVSSE